jgi:hypothetical protein
MKFANWAGNMLKSQFYLFTKISYSWDSVRNIYKKIANWGEEHAEISIFSFCQNLFLGQCAKHRTRTLQIGGRNMLKSQFSLFGKVIVPAQSSGHTSEN